MAPKRSANDDDSNNVNSRARKKQKLTEARTIAVQETNATAGPSSVRFGPVVHESMRNLPGAIDVEKFAESRSYEINAMKNAMKAAGSASTHRAWQVLPRHLRRRAASHDPRRVPLRLREKAKAEMDPVKKKALSRALPKLSRSKRITRSEELLKRQRDKRWLETHIWHAKRMHMEDMWGYRLAVTPTEKSFRPSHRASQHHSILHDASYMGLIELKGPEEILKSILEMMCDCQGPSPVSKRFIGGSRAVDIDFYEPQLYPYNFIGPVTIMWRPTPPSQESDSPDTNKGKGKGKTPPPPIKTAWIRCHPGLFDDVFSNLSQATSLALCNTSDSQVELADLRGAVNVFEVTGPKSSQVIRGALSPVMSENGEEFRDFWKNLGNLQTPGALPRNMVVGFKVHDPRLKFPPKNANIQYSDTSTSNPFVYPTSNLARSELWDETTRNKLKRPKYKKKDLDDRRAKNLIPGTPLNPLRQDDRVPVILIQRSVENSEEGTEATHGYTLIFPAGWGMVFLPSLIHTGTRVGGQRERAHQSFEAGKPYFPRDFPGTGLYEAYAKAREDEEKAKWLRTPPAKRVSYLKLGTRSPWRPDWEVVLGLSTAEQGQAEKGLVSTQREPTAPSEPDSMAVDATPATESEYKLPPWVIRGQELLKTLLQVSFQDLPVKLHETVEEYRKSRRLKSLPCEITPEVLSRSALVTVKLNPCGRGTPSDLALIYSMTEAELNEVAQSSDKSNDEVAFNPASDPIIGYVTTGGFSLSRGEGFAIGCLALARFLEMWSLAESVFNTGGKGRVFVKVRTRNGQQARLATMSLLP